MKDLETMTEKDLLYYAYSGLLEKLLREDDRNKLFREEFGRDSETVCSRVRKLSTQLSEVRKRILEI